MPFPTSPFPEDFDTDLLTKLCGDSAELLEPNKSLDDQSLKSLLEWLCTAPKLSSLRVNTLKTNPEEILRQISCQSFLHDSIPNTIIIPHTSSKSDLQTYPNEVIVDVHCAAAILRGAHIFAPGILGMTAGTKYEDKVSVFVDVEKKCKQGFNKIFLGKKIFLGNGLVRMVRADIFGDNLQAVGIAVKMFENTAGCPTIDLTFLSGKVILQNLPSIICVENLEAKPGEVVLDMCASPGNKTCHIAQLMNNEGVLIALDKTEGKVKILQRNCENFGTKATCFVADSTKICSESLSNESVLQGPPFSPKTFDRILLDVPCSVLGKRPQFSNTSSSKIIRSYVPLQRKLINSAVQLLKPGGTLVYSTCTITLAENEGMVSWALKKHPLKLKEPKLKLGQPGWFLSDLSVSQKNCLQRFGPHEKIDSIGFFMACFVKE